MARIFFDGFDHGSMKLWDSYSGTLDSSSKVTGPYSLTQLCYARKNTTRTDIYDVYLGFWINLGSTASGYLLITTGNGCTVKISVSGSSGSITGHDIFI